jgi:hypothetical protein
MEAGRARVRTPNDHELRKVVSRHFVRVAAYLIAEICARFWEENEVMRGGVECSDRWSCGRAGDAYRWLTTSGREIRNLQAGAGVSLIKAGVRQADRGVFARDVEVWATGLEDLKRALSGAPRTRELGLTSLSVRLWQDADACGTYRSWRLLHDSTESQHRGIYDLRVGFHSNAM